jgi:hypothetical protein
MRGTIREIHDACDRTTGRALAICRSSAPRTRSHSLLVDRCSGNSYIGEGQSRLRLRLLEVMDAGAVVEVALSLWAHEPRDTALSILDRAMATCEPHELDFAFEADQLHLPHPFAELIRLAFAPEFVPGAFSGEPITTTGTHAAHELQSEAVYAEWHKAIMCFADRYGLWLPFELDDEDSTPI